MKIGIDVGGSHIGVGLVDENGNLIKQIEKDIKKTENIKEEIVNYVDNAITELSQNGSIEHIGISAPGNPNGAKVFNIVNLGIEELDFSKIEEKYRIKIKSINDAKAAALAEKEYGELKNSKDGLFLCLGTGVGGAVFLNDRLLIANKHSGFEIGHMIIEREGLICNCGKRGCFETYCSIKKWKEKVFKVLGEIEDIENKDIYYKTKLLEKYKENEKINKIIEEYINNLIIGLSNLIDIFEPETIVLGGSFAYYEDILYKKLVKEMEQRRYVFNKESLPKIKLAKLKNDAGIIGATLL